METKAHRKLIIIGAGGHGRVAADIAAVTGKYDEIAFLDDGQPAVNPVYPVIGTTKDAERYIDEWDFFVAIGNNQIRKKITEKLTDAQAIFATLVHPSVILGSDVYIGKGSVLMPGVIVNNSARIGQSVILNTCCSVDHDCIVGDYCHVSPGAHLCGTVNLGNDVWIGAGATVINNTTVCDDCMIGAGAVVTGDICRSGVYVGVPAREMIRHRAE